MNASRFALELADEDAVRAAEKQEQAPADTNGQQHEPPPTGPRYVWRDPWWRRLLNCASYLGRHADTDPRRLVQLRVGGEADSSAAGDSGTEGGN